MNVFKFVVQPMRVDCYVPGQATSRWTRMCLKRRVFQEYDGAGVGAIDGILPPPPLSL